MDELKKIRLSLYGIFGVFFITLSINMYVGWMIDLDSWRFLYAITYIEPVVAVAYALMSIVGLVLLILMVLELKSEGHKILGFTGIGLLVVLFVYIFMIILYLFHYYYIGI